MSFTYLDELYPSASGTPSVYARLKNGYLVYIPNGTTCYVSAPPCPSVNNVQWDGLPLSPPLTPILSIGNDSLAASSDHSVPRYTLGESDSLPENITNDGVDCLTSVSLPLMGAKRMRKYYFLEPETLETIPRYYY